MNVKDKYQEAVRHAFVGKYGKEFDEFLRMICEMDTFVNREDCKDMYFVEGKRFVYQTLKNMLKEKTHE